MIIAEAPDFVLRPLAERDAPALHALLRDPDFLAQIGDRGGASVAEARTLITGRFAEHQATHGWGMWAIADRTHDSLLGMAGLVRRDGLDHVDVGYALLPAARGRGIAFRAARLVLDWAAARGIAPVVAIVSPGNAASIAVLEKLGLVASGLVRLPGASDDVMLYVPPEDRRR